MQQQSGEAQAKKPNGPVLHGTYDRPDSNDEEIMVKTEFVWADGADHDVKLAGAWNGWMPIQMYHEGGGMWSVVTPVPVGTHEFKFVVDEEWRHSTRHPTIGENEASINNIRVVRGPPRQKKPANQKGESAEAAQTGSSHNTSCCQIL